MSEATAYHEAGHALAAVLAGARVITVTIEPDRDDGPLRYGATQTAWNRRQFTQRELCERGVFVALGGPVAEMIFTGEPFHPGLVPEWADDWRQAWGEAAALHPQVRARLAFLERTAAEIHRRFNDDEHWAALAALADHLLAHDRAEWEEIEEIFAAWLGR